MHQSENILKGKLDDAARHVMVGELYSHYKNPGQTYRVINLVINEADNGVSVVYQAQYGSKLTFVRPLHIWQSTIKYKDQTVNRFTLLGR